MNLLRRIVAMLTESIRYQAKQLKEIKASGITNVKLPRCMNEEELGKEEELTGLMAMAAE
jgi:hypothetical protein